MLVEGKISFFISIVSKTRSTVGIKMKSSSRYFLKSDSLLCEIAFAIVVVE